MQPSGWSGADLKFEHTLYDVLEVSQRASFTVVKAAYRSLAQSHHPDKNLGQQESSGERLAEINNAYSVLSDPAKRSSYDQKLALGGTATERRSANSASGIGGVGHGSASHNSTRPYGFRPLD